jgi:hypothetical protein
MYLSISLFKISLFNFHEAYALVLNVAVQWGVPFVRLVRWVSFRFEKKQVIESLE